jgi:WD40 repeat protein
MARVEDLLRLAELVKDLLWRMSLPASPEQGPICASSPPRPPPKIPEYELLRCIGRGGYGAVWLARTVMGEYRAIKVVHRQDFEDDHPYEREFEGIRKFEPISRSHVGMMNILHVGREDAVGYFYYVMELADDAAATHGGSHTQLRGGRHVAAGKASNRSRLQSQPGQPARGIVSAATYVPKTLKTEIAQQGRLSCADCVRLGLLLVDAVEYLHEHGLVHRDIKPSNIIFVNGIPKLADIGLVAEVGERKSFVGTEGFIPPEGPGTLQADLYSLGKLIYVLSGAKSAQHFPEPLTEIGESPEHKQLLELNEVILKACESEPTKRYGSAGEMRADLLLLQSGRSLRGLRLAKRRTKQAMYFGIGAMVIAIIGTLIQQSRTAVAQAKASLAQEREQEQRRQTLIQQVQATRLSAHEGRWLDYVWYGIAEAAKIRKDADLQIQAAAALAGLDVSPIKRFTNFTASAVAFDAQGERLLLGGMNAGSMIWDRRSDQIALSPVTSGGLVTFRQDGTPVQFVATTNSSILLWDVGKQKPIREFAFGSSSDNGGPRPLLTVTAITPGGSLLATSIRHADQRSEILVWETRTGKIVRRVEAKANALAISPAGQLLAFGDEDGNLSILSLSSGDQVAYLKSGPVAIQSLAFARDMVCDATAAGNEPAWLLAGGDSGGTVTLWDIEARWPREKYRGSSFDVLALAFSPDGSLLASGGRSEIRLWDVANNRLLLALGSADFVTDLAFSPDGKRLAANGAGEATVWELQRGRGIDTLLGLSARIARVTFSANQKWLAAQTHNWELAVWDLSTRHIKRIFRAPQGSSQADNAAIALSPNGEQLAFAAGKAAKLWDVGSGEELGSWKIPDGYADQFIFPSTNKLLLFRAETLSGATNVFASDREKDPLVCHIRNLLGDDPTEPIAQITEFNWSLYGARVAQAGTFFVAEGFHKQNGELVRMIKAFDCFNGKTLWTKDSNNTAKYTALTIDPLGQVLSVGVGTRQIAWLEASSGTDIDEVLLTPSAIAPKRNYWTVLGRPGVSARGISLYRTQGRSPVVTFQIDPPTVSCPPEFSLDGSLLAWGNADGTVSLCDLEESRRQLSRLGLGW